MPEIALEGLEHVYADGAVRAVDGVDLVIGAGQRVAIIGQNGSGKTTLVRHFNGLLRPTAGRVRIDGEDVLRHSVAQLARVVGLVFQDPDRQIFAGSVRAEVEYGPRNVGLSGASLRAAVDAALSDVGLEAEAKTNPYDLGASRRKLLALASILAMGTPVLVLDEPTTGQDERGVTRIGSVIANASAAGRTVIAISHDMRFVAEQFERVIVLRAGRIILDGPPTVVFGEPAWPDLASTYLEPPLAALIGARAGLGATPTDGALVQALVARAGGPGGAGREA